MTRVVVCNRRTVESMDPVEDADHAFISIHTPNDLGEARLPTCGRTTGVLRLCFHDIDPNPDRIRPEDVERWRARIEHLRKDLFSEAMGSEVLEFARRHRHVAVMFVQCDAGLSRSPAVAAAVAKVVFDQDDDAWFRGYHPNRHVYRCILNAFLSDKEAWTEVP